MFGEKKNIKKNNVKFFCFFLYETSIAIKSPPVPPTKTVAVETQRRSVRTPHSAVTAFRRRRIPSPTDDAPPLDQPSEPAAPLLPQRGEAGLRHLHGHAV